VPSLYSWTYRLLLVVSLAILAITISAIWPGARGFGWMELAGVATLGLASVGTAISAVTAWRDD
jgi:hypothetical protein